MAIRRIYILLLAIGLTYSPAVVFSDQDSSKSNIVYRSPIHISIDNNKQIAYIVNQTSNSISILDIIKRKVTGEIPVGAQPTHAVLSNDGQTLYVTSNFTNSINVVNLKKRKVTRSIKTGFEPYGFVISSNGKNIYVANSLSNTVSIISIKSGKTTKVIPVGHNPRYITELKGGKQFVVGNGLSRSVSIIDVVKEQVVETRTLGRASLLRGVSSSPDGKWAVAAHLVSHDEEPTLQLERGWVHSNGFSIMDVNKPGAYVTLLLDQILNGAANPWGIIFSPDGERMYVSLAGVHEVAIVNVKKVLEQVSITKVEDVEALSENVEIVENKNIAIRVGSGGIGPRGLAFSQASGEVLIANYFSDTVTVMDAQTGNIKKVISISPTQEMTLERRGEMLFNNGKLSYQNWFSCSSCHQEDATADALNWDLPNDGLGNTKNVKSLHEAYDTPPVMWAGVRKDMDAGVQAGQRFLGFLPNPENHKALMAFLTYKNLNRVPNSYANLDKDSISRGTKVFVKARCKICHPPPKFTDQRKHDVGYGSKKDHRSRFDTSSLREIYRTAPYLHDGRAKTLREIFTKHNVMNLHGKTNNLTEKELDDLLAYVRSL